MITETLGSEGFSSQTSSQFTRTQSGLSCPQLTYNNNNDQNISIKHTQCMEV